MTQKSCVKEWTHALCDTCFERWTARPASSATRLRDPELETCCLCAQRTTSGIYMRIDPTLAHPRAANPTS